MSSNMANCNHSEKSKVKHGHLKMGVTALVVPLLNGCVIAPEHPLLHEAEVCMHNDELSVAETKFTAFIATHPRSDLELLALSEASRCYLYDRKFSESARSAKQALGLCRNLYGPEEPYAMTIMVVLASAQAALKDYAAATQTCVAGLALAQKCDHSLHREMLLKLRLADINAREGKYKDAISIYEQLLKENKQPFVIIRLARCYSADGQKDAALDLLKHHLPPMSEAALLAGSTAAFDLYIQLLHEAGKAPDESAVRAQRDHWLALSQQYYSWEMQRTEKGSRFEMVRKITDWDAEILPEDSRDHRQ